MQIEDLTPELANTLHDQLLKQVEQEGRNLTEVEDKISNALFSYSHLPYQYDMIERLENFKVWQATHQVANIDTNLEDALRKALEVAERSKVWIEAGREALIEWLAEK